MRLQYLHYLLVIDAHHSISSAARELYVSQSALSSILSRVEDELGFPIFVRSRNGVTPTEDGREVLSIVWDIWSKHQLALRINRQDEEVPLPVHLISSPGINCGLTIPLIQSFHQRESLGNLIFHEGMGRDLIASVVQNRVNIGLAYLSQDDFSALTAAFGKYPVQTSCLFKDKLLFIVRQNSPLAKQNAVDAADIQSLRLVVPSQFLAETPHFYTRLLSQKNYFTVFPSVPYIKKAILDWNACGILSGFAFTQDKSIDASKLLAISIQGLKEEGQLLLCLLQYKGLCRQEQSLLRCIYDYFDGLSRQNDASSCCDV